MKNDYHRKAVVITGGTKGIGLATGLAFGRAGAHVYLTHHWGSADEDAVRKQFAEAGAPVPAIVEADASKDDDTTKLLELVRKDHESLEVLVANVCAVPVVEGVDSLSKRGLLKSIEYSSWPFVASLRLTKKVFGRYPRYLIGTSSDGMDHYYQGYDYVAVVKAVMETLCRYLTRQLLREDIRINMVRTRNVITESALAIHGADYPEFVRKFGGEHHFVQTEEVGDAIFALCSGLLDAYNGQVLTVDRGGSFSDNLFRVYHAREELGL
jgi:NAD(P)-dependent dehydrogenase (short-subunit alcohol dehydrogenase family)